jgi:hypothetical protein
MVSRQRLAVSALNILLPNVIGMNPRSVDSLTSSSLSPPSGPTMKKISFFSSDFSSPAWARTCFRPISPLYHRISRRLVEGTDRSISE